MANTEYLTLVQCTDKLCNGIAQDPLAVCLKLFVNRLVSEAQVRNCQLESKDKYSNASELVSVVTGKVDSFPHHFEAILAILNGFPWLQDVVTYVRGQYEAKGGKAVDPTVRPTLSIK